MASLNQDILKRISLPVVSRGTQDRIAFVLGAFDDLIVNNSRRIEILEEMARAIYGEWFVEFRYPGHEGVPLVESELGPIPEGWEVAPLSDLSTKLTDGDWVETKDQGGDDFRLLQVSNIGVGRFRETGKFRYVTQETFDRLRCTEIEIGDILISRMPDPVGRAWLVDYLDVPAITAVDVAILTPFTPATGLYVSELLNSSATLAQMAAMATGTTRARVTRKVISAMPVLRPSEAILEKYGDIVGDFARLKSVLTRQSDSLKATRDLLLPGLVSGDINVSGLDLDDVA